MTRKTFLGLMLLVLVSACGGRQHSGGHGQMHEMARYKLGANAEISLLSDGNLSQVEIYYGGELQDLAGTANTEYVCNDEGRVVVDTVTDAVMMPAYVVRTYDRSSTYGAEVWYVVYPYRPDDLDGPWNLVKLPIDRPSIEDVARYID